MQATDLCLFRESGPPVLVQSRFFKRRSYSPSVTRERTSCVSLGRLSASAGSRSLSALVRVSLLCQFTVAFSAGAGYRSLSASRERPSCASSVAILQAQIVLPSVTRERTSCVSLNRLSASAGARPLPVLVSVSLLCQFPFAFSAGAGSWSLSVT